MWPSLAVALPVFVVGLLVYITLALVVAFFRATYIDFWGVVTCVAMMSISTMFYIIGSLGGPTRLYRTFFLEEMSKDYVRTARAKGLAEGVVLLRHVLKNAMIPILTGAVGAIPLLFMGRLITESFFGILGLGGST